MKVSYDQLLAVLPPDTVNVNGTGWGWGWTAGVTLTPTPTTQIGIGYRSAHRPGHRRQPRAHAGCR